MMPFTTLLNLEQKSKRAHGKVITKYEVIFAVEFVGMLRGYTSDKWQQHALTNLGLIMSFNVPI